MQRLAEVPRLGAVTTYLDFGMVTWEKRTCYDYREGQQAYDLFMGARYLNDMIAYREGRVDAVITLKTCATTSARTRGSACAVAPGIA